MFSQIFGMQYEKKNSPKRKQDLDTTEGSYINISTDEMIQSK
jgi:hypothetical protein